jgi:hypothetical protein
MKECSIDFERAVVTDYQAPEVSGPADCAFNDPAFSVSVQRAAILRGRANAIFLVWADQFDPAPPQTIPQRIAVVSFVRDHAHRLLPRPPARRRRPARIDASVVSASRTSAGDAE